ncbi:right-handed parallel beta-helix repeat-containing protein [Cloacibacillus sp.]|uniref:Synerg-CTERM sorting domain-containing protein n=1 Tax=Cloacibacillus sp. TaxID=2049023 RepID=UPI00341E38F0
MHNVQIDKPLKVLGAGREKTIFKADLAADYSDFILILGHVGEYGKDIAGTEISGIGFKYKTTGEQTAAIYYTGKGGKDAHVVIKGCSFTGDKGDTKSAIGITTPYSEEIGYLDVTDNIFKDMGYAMYFNSLKYSSITGNTVTGTKYNAINIAADNSEQYKCEGIVVSGNKLSEISRVGYEEDEYSSGIRIGENASGNTVTNNEIHMLNDKKAYFGFDQAAKLKTEVFFATLKEAVDIVEDNGIITLLADSEEEFSIAKNLEMLFDKETKIKAAAGNGYELNKYKTKYAVSKRPVKPVPPVDINEKIEPVAAETKKADPSDQAAKEKVVADISGAVKEDSITSKDIEVDTRGNVVAKKEVAEAAAADAVKKSGSGVTVKEIVPLPVFSASLAKEDDIAMVAYILTGNELKASKVEAVRVLKITSSNTGKFFSFEDNPADFGDGEYAIQTSQDVLLKKGAALDVKDSYKLLLMIKDNGEFDLSSAKKEIIDPAAIVSTTAPTPKPQPHGSSSSGCSAAGWGSLVLLAALPLFRKKR